MESFYEVSVYKKFYLSIGLYCWCRICCYSTRGRDKKEDKLYPVQYSTALHSAVNCLAKERGEERRSLIRYWIFDQKKARMAAVVRRNCIN
jgi:hypothetical protein